MLIKKINVLFSNTSNESIKYLWNGENFNAFGGLLRACRELKHVDISKLNTKNAKTLSYTFSYSKIKEIDMSKINTENIEDLSKIFCGCKELEKVILPKFMKKLNVEDMFKDCIKLRYVYYHKENKEIAD